MSAYDGPVSRAGTPGGVSVPETGHRVELEAPLDEALEALADAAELWDAEWHRLGTGGRLVLPVSAGLRLGLVRGQVSTEATGAGTRVVFHEEESHYHLRLAHVVVLVIGALGALVTVLVPFYPQLFALVPISGMVLLLAWFLVASRLRSSGVVEFLGMVKQFAEGPLEPPEALAVGASGDSLETEERLAAGEQPARARE